MTDWIDYCPSCGMPFVPETPKKRWARKVLKQWEPGDEFPSVEALEVRCTFGHSFDAEDHEYRQGQGVRVKLL